MRVFDRDGKWNFVDDNNVFVGYDSYQCCCEHAGYQLSQDPEAINSLRCDSEMEPDPPEEELARYTFDTTYFEADLENSSFLYEGEAVQFRLVANDLPPLYLLLFNCHNGYYAHGFDAKVGGQDWQDGYI